MGDNRQHLERTSPFGCLTVFCVFQHFTSLDAPTMDMIYFGPCRSIYRIFLLAAAFSADSILSALKKTTLEEWRGVYVGVRSAPAPPHIPVLFSRLTFFQWSKY